MQPNASSITRMIGTTLSLSGGIALFSTSQHYVLANTLAIFSLLAGGLVLASFVITRLLRHIL
jgi:hypothetical protein